jgi:hypothetical protein
MIIAVKPLELLNKALLVLGCFLLSSLLTNSQTFLASPSNWMLPNGNSEATRIQKTKSGTQTLNKFEVKWFNSSIYGDVQPLIGNIINNPKLDPAFNFSPNEIIAAVGGKIIIVDATGKTHKTNNYPMPLIKNVSMLYSPNDVLPGSVSNDILDIGLESIEHQSLFDSLTFAFIGRYDLAPDTVKILRRLALDIRNFPKNTFASITPIFGKSSGADQLIYALVNMTKPVIDTSLVNNQFFRGIALFNTADSLPAYPVNDIGDDINNRVLLGPIVSLSPPSLYRDMGNNNMTMLLPTFCDIDTSNASKYEITNKLGQKTKSNNPYLLSYNITQDTIAAFGNFDFSSLIDTTSRKPVIKQYFAEYMDLPGNSILCKIVSEEYTGFDGSDGIAKIHLFDPSDAPITSFGSTDLKPFIGKKNHGWSIAVGDLDGASFNEWLPYYPNNKGQEIIVAQTTKNLAVAQSRLMILRYRPSLSKIPKVSPPNSFLMQFDTIATQQINGWIAAVNDLDAEIDGKDEVVLVDGANLTVLRLKNYSDNTFRSGKVFDTVYAAIFPNETIFSAEVADVDGDGKNDLIATTNKGTYLIGSQQPGLLKILTPKSPPATFCEGEKIDIKWYAKQKYPKGIEVKFVPRIGGNLVNDSAIILGTIIPALKDTDQVSINVDSNFIGKTGVFVIWGIGSKTSADTSADFTFNAKSFAVDTFWNQSYRAGESFFLKCKSSCYDSVHFQFRVNTSWIDFLPKQKIAQDSFWLQAIAPCIDGYFCSMADTNVSIDIRYIVSTALKSDTSASHTVMILPATFPVTWDTNTTACPTKVFKWRYGNFLFPCDTIEALASFDGGLTYASVGSVSAIDQQFIWRVPTNQPDSVLFRFCAVGSCMRMDTVVAGYKAQYISIVAPNPLNPTRDVLEIIYSIPDQTKVNIKILDESNRLVRFLIDGESRNANTVYCDKWDGTLTDGTLAANGMYFISLEISNTHREIYPVFVRK